MWAASGAWFTYVANAVASRQETYEGIGSLVKGLDAELELASQWASGGEGEKGYLVKKRFQLVKENPDWFNPSRMVFSFHTPVLSNVTDSHYAGALSPVIHELVMLNHSIRRLFESMERLQAFAIGNVLLYQGVMEKLAPKTSPTELAMSTTPTVITAPVPHQIPWTEEERAYINMIFMMNEGIHQGLIGGADSENVSCLYKTFRAARKALTEFKRGLKREPLPREFWILHVVAGSMAWLGLWEMMRWFEIW